MDENDKKRFNELFQKHTEAIQFYHRLIAEMRAIQSEAMTKFAEKAKTTGIKRDGPSILPEICEARILHSFVGHMTLFKAGVLIDSYGSLRTIYENIMRAYAIHCFPEIAEAAWHSYMELGDELAKKYEFKFKWLGHKFLARTLYKEPYSDNQSYKIFYGVISGKVHTTLKGMAGLFTLKEEDFIDTLKMGIGLAYANFLLLLELYGNIVPAEKLASLPHLLLEGQRFIPEGVPTLVPDVEACKSKLAMRNHMDLLDKFKI